MNSYRDPDFDPQTSSTAKSSDPLRDVDGIASASIPRPDATSKVDLGTRAIALLIDSAIAFVLSVIPVIGGIIGAAYFVFRDGLEFDYMNRRSVGKHLMNIRPVRLDGNAMDLETSFKRNWMFGLGAVATVLMWIPILGWAIAALILTPLALAIGLYEVYRVVTDPNGRRWGDSLGGTQVVKA